MGGLAQSVDAQSDLFSPVDEQRGLAQPVDEQGGLAQLVDEHGIAQELASPTEIAAAAEDKAKDEDRALAGQTSAHGGDESAVVARDEEKEEEEDEVEETAVYAETTADAGVKCDEENLAKKQKIAHATHVSPAATLSSPFENLPAAGRSTRKREVDLASPASPLRRRGDVLAERSRLQKGLEEALQDRDYTRAA